MQKAVERFRTRERARWQVGWIREGRMDVMMRVVEMLKE